MQIENISEEDWNKLLKIISDGKKFIYEERYEKWEQCVFNDFAFNNSKGVLGALKIMSSLDEGKTIDEVKNEFEKQEYPYGIYLLINTIVLSFSKKGPEFYEATADEFMMRYSDDTIKQIKEHNSKYAENEKKLVKNIPNKQYF